MGSALHLSALLSDRRGRADESEALHRRALGLREALAAEFPGSAEYRSDCGATLNNLALRLKQRGDLAEARRLLEQAMEHQRAALKINPRRAQTRAFLHNHCTILVDVLCRLGEHGEAVRVADDWAGLFPDGWAESVQAARHIVGCILVAERDQRLSVDRREELVRRYGDQVVERLRHAVARGYRGLGELARLPDFERLRQRDDFQQLLAGGEAKPPEPRNEGGNR
jgi:tetratricopeptide (TPR) repeat protein